MSETNQAVSQNLVCWLAFTDTRAIHVLFFCFGVGALKMTDMKLQDMKLTDRVAGHEIAGHENGGPNSRT